MPAMTWNGPHPPPELIDAYFGEVELDPALTEELDSHLGWCDECQVRAGVGFDDSGAHHLRRIQAREITAPQPTVLPTDKFDMVERIGAGGMGVVYRARHIDLGRMVAVKLVHRHLLLEREADTLFEREARLAATLDHVNIVQVHDAGRHSGVRYLVMQYVEGGNLQDLSFASPSEEAAIVRLVALAIASAHTAEPAVLHLDLKPANILVDTDRIPYVADFGLSQLAASAAATGAGTPGYIPPELLNRDNPTTTADVYGLGAILYYRLTRRPPSRPLIFPNEVPAELIAVCARCLAFDPARRYPTAAAVATDLSRFMTRHPVRARRYWWVRSGPWWVRRHPYLAAIFAVIALGIAISSILNHLFVVQPAAELKDKVTQDQQTRYHQSIMQAEALWEIAPDEAITKLNDPKECPTAARDDRWEPLQRLSTRPEKWRRGWKKVERDPSDGNPFRLTLPTLDRQWFTSGTTRTVLSPDARSAVELSYGDLPKEEGSTEQKKGCRLRLQSLDAAGQMSERLIRTYPDLTPGRQWQPRVSSLCFDPTGNRIAVIAVDKMLRPHLDILRVDGDRESTRELMTIPADLTAMRWIRPDLLLFAHPQYRMEGLLMKEGCRIVSLDPATGKDSSIFSPCIKAVQMGAWPEQERVVLVGLSEDLDVGVGVVPVVRVVSLKSEKASPDLAIGDKIRPHSGVSGRRLYQAGIGFSRTINQIAVAWIPEPGGKVQLTTHTIDPLDE